MTAMMDKLIAQNRALVTRNAELERALADAQSDHYREVWKAITQALDQVSPNWQDSGPTALSAAVATILGSTGANTLSGFLAVRGPDMVPVLSIVSARAYENKGYSIHPQYLR